MNKRILLVDDDSKFQNAMALVLRDKDYSVVQSRSIGEAEVELELGKFDLIIADGILPDGDGPTWIRTLRDRDIDVPVVFVSALFRDSDSFNKLSMDRNVRLILQKPISLNVFGEEISAVLEDSHAQGFGARTVELLKELKAQYARDLPMQLAALARAVFGAANLPHDIALLHTAADQAHLIRGTSGMYGFGPIGEATATIEDVLRLMLSDDNELRRCGNWSKLELGLRSALDLLEEHNCSPAVLQESKHRGRVMLLTDERKLTQRVESILSADGILAYSFLDAEALDHILETVRPDVLLIDLNASLYDGTAVCKQVRHTSDYQGIPIIGLTGGNDNCLLTSARVAGVTECLSKTAINVELNSTVRKHFPATAIANPIDRNSLLPSLRSDSSPLMRTSA